MSANRPRSRRNAPRQPLSGWLLRRRRRPWTWVIGALLLAVMVWADRSGWLLYDGGDMRVYDGQAFVVEHVIDGDTLDVRHPDGNRPTTRVRLWGIDTPERARPREGLAAEPWAEEATDFVRERALGRSVTLTLESHRLRDNDGRILAFVTLPDGTLLNEALVTSGLARSDGRWSHRYVDRFDLIEYQARRDQRGRWKKPPRQREGESDDSP